MLLQRLRNLPTFVLSLAWRSYLRKLRSNPLLTKALTSGILSVLSEVFAKSVTAERLQTSAAMKELTAGLLLRGPVVHAFHTFLDKVVFVHSEHTSPRIVLLKLVIDQLLFAPLFTALYLYFIALFNDQGVNETTRNLRRDLPHIMRSNWAVWLPANLISYAAIPLELRVLFGNIVGFFWNAYLIAIVSAARRRTLD